MIVNEDFIYALYENIDEVSLIEIPIENNLLHIISKLEDLCDNPNTTLLNIYKFLQSKDELNTLNGATDYCEDLKTPFQEFYADNQEKINKIFNQYILFKNNPNQREKEKFKFKFKIKRDYILWSKATAINNAYNVCRQHSVNIAFSHRKRGWTNPAYQLTTNFSVEMKTNFGYGRNSYFYVIIKYKEIQIIPFSDWIIYENAKFSELIHYTKSYNLYSECWKEAMHFARDACNLSINNVDAFIKEYVINECEKMINGLQKILKDKKLSFKNQKDNSYYPVEKTGRALLNLQGEKISGALNFLSKIIEFNNIAKVDIFIKKIESFNIKFYPILIKEIGVIIPEINKLEEEKKILSKKLKSYEKEKEEWEKKKNIFDEENSKTAFRPRFEGEIENPFNKRNSNRFLFSTEFPEYEEFIKTYKDFNKNKYIGIVNKIERLNDFKNDYSNYVNLIKKYFDKIDLDIIVKKNKVKKKTRKKSKKNNVINDFSELRKLLNDKNKDNKIYPKRKRIRINFPRRK